MNMNTTTDHHQQRRGPMIDPLYHFHRGWMVPYTGQHKHHGQQSLYRHPQPDPHKDTAHITVSLTNLLPQLYSPRKKQRIAVSSAQMIKQIELHDYHLSLYHHIQIRSDPTQPQPSNDDAHTSTHTHAHTHTHRHRRQHRDTTAQIGVDIDGTRNELRHTIHSGIKHRIYDDIDVFADIGIGHDPTFAIGVSYCHTSLYQWIASLLYPHTRTATHSSRARDRLSTVTSTSLVYSPIDGVSLESTYTAHINPYHTLSLHTFLHYTKPYASEWRHSNMSGKHCIYYKDHYVGNINWLIQSQTMYKHITCRYHYLMRPRGRDGGGVSAERKQPFNSSTWYHVHHLFCYTHSTLYHDAAPSVPVSRSGARSDHVLSYGIGWGNGKHQLQTGTFLSPTTGHIGIHLGYDTPYINFTLPIIVAEELSLKTVLTVALAIPLVAFTCLHLLYKPLIQYKQRSKHREELEIAEREWCKRYDTAMLYQAAMYEKSELIYHAERMKGSKGLVIIEATYGIYEEEGHEGTHSHHDRVNQHSTSMSSSSSADSAAANIASSPTPTRESLMRGMDVTIPCRYFLSDGRLHFSSHSKSSIPGFAKLSPQQVHKILHERRGGGGSVTGTGRGRSRDDDTDVSRYKYCYVLRISYSHNSVVHHATFYDNEYVNIP